MQYIQVPNIEFQGFIFIPRVKNIQRPASMEPDQVEPDPKSNPEREPEAKGKPETDPDPKPSDSGSGKQKEKNAKTNPKSKPDGGDDEKEREEKETPQSAPQPRSNVRIYAARPPVGKYSRWVKLMNNRVSTDSDAFEAYVSLMKLRDDNDNIFGSEQISLVELVIMGSQSAGKSTLVASFFPEAPASFTSAGTGTRCPVRYILRSRGEEKEVDLTIITTVHGKKAVNHGGDIKSAITAMREHMMELLNTGVRFSPDPFVVELSGKLIKQDLVLLDLPGLRGRAESEEEKQDIRVVEMISQVYVRKPDTIIVAVDDATLDENMQIGWKTLRSLCTNPDLVRYQNIDPFPGCPSKPRNDYKAHTVFVGNKIDSVIESVDYSTNEAVLSKFEDATKISRYYDQLILTSLKAAEGNDSRRRDLAPMFGTGKDGTDPWAPASVELWRKYRNDKERGKLDSDQMRTCIGILQPAYEEAMFNEFFNSDRSVDVKKYAAWSGTLRARNITIGMWWERVLQPLKKMKESASNYKVRLEGELYALVAASAANQPTREELFHWYSKQLVRFTRIILQYNENTERFARDAGVNVSEMYATHADVEEKLKSRYGDPAALWTSTQRSGEGDDSVMSCYRSPGDLLQMANENGLRDFKDDVEMRLTFARLFTRFWDMFAGMIYSYKYAPYEMNEIISRASPDKAADTFKQNRWQAAVKELAAIEVRNIFIGSAEPRDWTSPAPLRKAQRHHPSPEDKVTDSLDPLHRQSSFDSWSGDTTLTAEEVIRRAKTKISSDKSSSIDKKESEEKVSNRPQQALSYVVNMLRTIPEMALEMADRIVVGDSGNVVNASLVKQLPRMREKVQEVIMDEIDSMIASVTTAVQLHIHSLSNSVFGEHWTQKRHSYEIVFPKRQMLAPSNNGNVNGNNDVPFDLVSLVGGVVGEGVPPLKPLFDALPLDNPLVRSVANCAIEMAVFNGVPFSAGGTAVQRMSVATLLNALSSVQGVYGTVQEILSSDNREMYDQWTKTYSESIYPILVADSSRIAGGGSQPGQCTLLNLLAANPISLEEVISKAPTRAEKANLANAEVEKAVLALNVDIVSEIRRMYTTHVVRRLTGAINDTAVDPVWTAVERWAATQETNSDGSDSSLEETLKELDPEDDEEEEKREHQISELAARIVTVSDIIEKASKAIRRLVR